MLLELILCDNARTELNIVKKGSVNPIILVPNLNNAFEPSGIIV